MIWSSLWPFVLFAVGVVVVIWATERLLEGLVGLAETAQVEGVHREPLRETSGELFPDARRREPTVNQKDRRSTADDVVADPVPLELQKLGIAYALYLVGAAPERDGGGEDDSDHQKQDNQNGSHGRNDNPHGLIEHGRARCREPRPSGRPGPA